MSLNINKATVQDVQALGLNSEWAKYVIDFREYLKANAPSSGGFTNADDFKQLNLPADYLQILLGNVSFGQNGTGNSSSAVSNLNDLLGSLPGNKTVNAANPLPQQDEVLLASNDAKFFPSQENNNTEEQLMRTDFIKCHFTDDPKPYVAEIVNSFDGGEFECRFVHTNGICRFSKEGGMISGSLGVGRHIFLDFEIYRKQQSIPYAAGQYVAVTFRDNKKYLGIMTSISPNYEINFLHSGKNYSFSYDLEIVRSEGAYKKGEPIFLIENYAAVTAITASPEAVTFDDIQEYKNLERRYLLASKAEEAALLTEIINKKDLNTPFIEVEARDNLKRIVGDQISRLFTAEIEAKSQVEKEIEEEIKKEDEFREFILDVVTGFVIIPGIIKAAATLAPTLISKAGKAAEAVKDFFNDTEKVEKLKSFLEKASNYPTLKDKLNDITKNKDEREAYLDKVIEESEDHFRKVSNMLQLKTNEELFSLLLLYNTYNIASFKEELSSLVSEYEAQVAAIWENGDGLGDRILIKFLVRIKINENSDKCYLAIVQGFPPSEQLPEGMPSQFLTWVLEKFANQAESRMLTKSSLKSNRSYIPKAGRNWITGAIPEDVAIRTYND